MDFGVFKENLKQYCDKNNIDFSQLYIKKSNSDSTNRFEFKTSGTTDDLLGVVFVIVYYPSIERFVVWDNTGTPRRTKFSVNAESVKNAINIDSKIVVKDKGIRGGPEELVRVYSEKELLNFVFDYFK